jgi:hypothetical protein
MNMPIGKLFFFVPQTSSSVNASGVGGNPYVDGAQYSAHTSMGYDGIAIIVLNCYCYMYM